MRITPKILFGLQFWLHPREYFCSPRNCRESFGPKGSDIKLPQNINNVGGTAA